MNSERLTTAKGFDIGDIIIHLHFTLPFHHFQEAASFEKDSLYIGRARFQKIKAFTMSNPAKTLLATHIKRRFAFFIGSIV